MAAPRQMTAETLNALKGWPSQTAVDFTAKLAASVTSRVPAGSVVRLNNSLEFELGVGTRTVMPMFTFHASDDPDIVNDGGSAASVKGVFIAIAPTGQMLALVANGAYELVSTNFVAGTYNPNTLLTSADSGGTAGQLVAGVLKTNTIVGIVSRGVVDNGYGTNALAFWPWVMPSFS